MSRCTSAHPVYRSGVKKKQAILLHIKPLDAFDQVKIIIITFLI